MRNALLSLIRSQCQEFDDTIICRPMQLRRLNDRVTEIGSLNAPKVTQHKNPYVMLQIFEWTTYAILQHRLRTIVLKEFEFFELTCGFSVLCSVFCSLR